MKSAELRNKPYNCELCEYANLPTIALFWIIKKVWTFVGFVATLLKTPRLWNSTGKPHIYPGLQFYIVIFVIVNFMPKVLWTIIPTKFIKFKQVSVVNCASFIVPDEVNWKLIYRLYLAFLNKKNPGSCVQKSKENWSLYGKMALGEVGVSLSWWRPALVLLAPGYWSLFLNLIIFS